MNFEELDLTFAEKRVHPIQVSAGMYNLLNHTGATEHMDSAVMGEEFSTPFTTLTGDDLSSLLLLLVWLSIMTQTFLTTKLGL